MLVEKLTSSTIVVSRRIVGMMLLVFISLALTALVASELFGSELRCSTVHATDASLRTLVCGNCSSGNLLKLN